MSAATNPHGFTIEWLRIAPGEQVGRYMLDAKQVLIVFEGIAEIVLNEAEEVSVRVQRQDLFSAR